MFFFFNFLFYVFLSILGMPKNNLQVGNSIQSQILPLFFIILFVAFLESFTADIEVFDYFFSGSVIFRSYFIGLYKMHNLVFIIMLVLVNEQWSGIWTWGQILFFFSHSEKVPGGYLIRALNFKGSGLF